MSKTYRGSSKDQLKDKYKKVREERQNKRHVGKDDKKEASTRPENDKYGSRGQGRF